MRHIGALAVLSVALLFSACGPTEEPPDVPGAVEEESLGVDESELGGCVNGRKRWRWRGCDRANREPCGAEALWRHQKCIDHQWRNIGYFCEPTVHCI
jgi:hypothetical protein